jgi:AcrR family transcriptional regulator
MLDAAEDVVLRDGIGRLTLDAVAREASLSKGGLMHHFPTKDALIDAMVRRKVDAWRTEYEAAIEREIPGPGRVARAIIGLCLCDTNPGGDAECRRCFVLMAALVHDAKHVAPLREAHRNLESRLLADGLLRGMAEVVQLAMSGLWFDRMFGLTAFTPEKLGEIRSALLELADTGAAEAALQQGGAGAGQAGI